MSKLALTVAVTVILIGAGGCGGDQAGTGGSSVPTAAGPDSVPGLSLIPVTQRTSAGTDVEVRLQNDSALQATYGACPTLERRSGDSFVPASTEPMACIEIAYVTAPGETGGALGITVPSSLDAGEYRITHQITLPDGPDQVRQVVVHARLDVTA